MKKILIFSTAYLPFLGGAEVAVKEITDRLGGFYFDMVTARLDKKLPKTERIGNIDVHRIGIGIPKFDKYLLAFFGHRFAQKLHKKNNYNAIWSIMASYGGFAAMFFKKKNPDLPFLLTLQEGDDPEYINKRVGILKSQFKQIFAKADYIQCISNFLVEWAKKMGARNPVEVVPNGVDLNKFKVQSSKLKVRVPTKWVQSLKIKLNIEEGEKIIIHHGRLVPKNGLIDLVEAISLLPIIGCQVPVKLLLIGGGYQKKFLKEKVKNLSLEDKVLFLDEMPHEEMPKYLAISDIFVRPSLSEGLGSAFLEAMAAGVPIIGTLVGGIPDFLKDGETGLFCQVRNPKSIADKVKILLENNELRQKIIANAKALVAERYDWNLIADKMEKIFNQLVTVKTKN